MDYQEYPKAIGSQTAYGPEDEERIRGLMAATEQETQSAASAIHELNAADAKALIDAAPDAATLDGYQIEEQANPTYDGGRVGVLNAISARREALAGGGA